MVTTRSQTAASAPAALPLKEYFSSLSYLTLLLAGTVAVLPRSTAWFYDTTGRQQTTSADRPESPLLTPLTADPAGTAAWTLVGLAIVMGWWGNKMRRWAGATASQGARMKSATLATLATALLLLALATLLGAPLRLWQRTLLFALNLALLTAYPAVAALGLPDLYETGIAARYRLTRLVCEWRSESALERAIVYPMAGALVGAWVGAVPLALDWDRPWQAWPLTALASAVLGFAVGSWASWGVSALDSLKQEIADDKAANAPKAPVQKKKKGRKSAQ